MGLMESVVEGAFDVLEPVANFLVGYPPPPADAHDYIPKTYPLTSPFWNEADRWRRDPFYRRGILGAPFTMQFRDAPLSAVVKFLEASFFGQ
mgnify:CR=1 FL=1